MKLKWSLWDGHGRCHCGWTATVAGWRRKHVKAAVKAVLGAHHAMAHPDCKHHHPGLYDQDRR